MTCSNSADSIRIEPLCISNNRRCERRRKASRFMLCIGSCLVVILTIMSDATLALQFLCQPSRIRQLHAPKLSIHELQDSSNSLYQSNMRGVSSRQSGSMHNRFHQLQTSTVSYEKQITILGRKGHTDQALQLFSSLEAPSLRQINAILDACARADPPRLSTALGIFQSHFHSRSSHRRPNVYTFGALISACARAGNVSEATRLLEDMKVVYGVTANAVVYHSAISACARTIPARVDRALQLLEQAEREGIALTVIGYNAAVATAARSADADVALKILSEMESGNNHTIDHSNSNAKHVHMIPHPDAVTYATVMAACESSKKWDLILQVATQMMRVGFVLDGMAITSVLHACQQLGLANDAIHYLSMMKQSSLPTYKRSTAGRKVASCKSDLHGPDEVAYRLVISACARGKAWKEAIQTLDEYIDHHPSGKTDIIAYTTAIKACEYVGEWKAAFSLLDRMKLARIEPNELTYAAVIGSCATASGKITSLTGRVLVPVDASTFLLPQLKALQLLQVLRNDESLTRPTIQVYNAAIRACAEAMDLKTSLQLFNDLQQDHLVPTIVTYGCLMTACERVGSSTTASKVFKWIRESGIHPNEIIYGAAISCCRKAGEKERAFSLLKKMIRENCKPNIAVFNTVFIAQTEGNPTVQEFENALLAYMILRQYSSASPNRQTYNILIRAFSSHRQPRQAEKFLIDMRRDGLVPDVDLFTCTISSYERIGQPLNALSLMESMREDGYDFYDLVVLNSAFKKAVKFANALGKGYMKPKDTTDFTKSNVLGIDHQ